MADQFKIADNTSVSKSFAYIIGCNCAGGVMFRNIWVTHGYLTCANLCSGVRQTQSCLGIVNLSKQLRLVLLFKENMKGGRARRID